MSAKKPVPGDYYINETGQLIKVRYVLYKHSAMSMVMLQYQDGYHLSISPDEWRWLDLKPYSEWFFGAASADTGQ